MPKDFEELRKEILACACHAAWYAYTVIGLGEPGAPWHEAPEWQKESIRNAVDFWDEMFEKPDVTVQDLCIASHENWMRFRESDDWVYGPKKDSDLKTHPCMVPYADLPEEQKAKDQVAVGTYIQMQHAL